MNKRNLCGLKLYGYDANGTQPKMGEFRSTSFYHRAPDTASESWWMREKLAPDPWQRPPDRSRWQEAIQYMTTLNRIASELQRPLYFTRKCRQCFPVMVVDPQ